MKPAHFESINGLPIDVTISIEARKWVHEEYVSVRTYAEVQVQRHIDGKSVDRGVVIEDRRFVTVSDKRPSGDARREHVAQGSTELKAPVDSAAGSPAQPSDKGASYRWDGRFPRWLMTECYEEDGSPALAKFSDRSDMAACFQPRGIKDMQDRGWDDEPNEWERDITPTEAAKWLRENGHPEEAARIQADTAAVHPALAGARCLEADNHLALFVNESRGETWMGHRSSGWEARPNAHMRWDRFTRLGDWRELHGPERARILADFAASAAFAEWIGGGK